MIKYIRILTFEYAAILHGKGNFTLGLELKCHALGDKQIFGIAMAKNTMRLSKHQYTAHNK